MSANYETYFFNLKTFPTNLSTLQPPLNIIPEPRNVRLPFLNVSKEQHNIPLKPRNATTPPLNAHRPALRRVIIAHHLSYKWDRYLQIGIGGAADADEECFGNGSIQEEDADFLRNIPEGETSDARGRDCEY